MWGSHGLRLLGQQAARRSYSNSSLLSRQATGETYNVSDLLLELDNIDNKLVRKYEDWKAEKQERVHPDDLGARRRPDSPIQRDKNSKRRASGSSSKLPNLPEILDASSQLKKAHTRPLPRAAYHPRNADYVTLALSPDSTSKAFRNVRPVLQRHDIRWPHGREDFEVVVERLKESASDFPSYLSDGARLSTADGRGQLLKTMIKCQHLSDLSRVTGLVAQTSEGCQLLASYGSAVTMAIKNCLEGNADFRNALKVLNGLCLNIKSKSLSVGPALCDAGMYLAARSGVMPAISRYIETALEERYPVSRNQLLALEWTRRLIEPRYMEDTTKSTLSTIRKDVLSLLTGWASCGTPDRGEERKPCFASLVGDSHYMYSAYVKTLGKMGASEALWHEWSQPQLTPMPLPHRKTFPRHELKNPSADGLLTTDAGGNTMAREELRADRFFGAFLRAKDLQRARVLSQSMSRADEDLHPPWATATEPASPPRPRGDLGDKWHWRSALLGFYERHGIGEVGRARITKDLHNIRPLLLPRALLPEIEHLLAVEWIEGQGGDGPGFHVSKG
ncbi:MAG: hypothetical protein M1818_003781 [Claussenomyces sp. TS43310]|nr:MAG: hypothetical protein M1818_003781 [Claussenomyces sp. TS43310]